MTGRRHKQRKRLPPLPPELLLTIFSEHKITMPDDHCDEKTSRELKQRLNTLRAISLASKQFNALVAPVLYFTLDFRLRGGMNSRPLMDAVKVLRSIIEKPTLAAHVRQLSFELADVTFAYSGSDASRGWNMHSAAMTQGLRQTITAVIRQSGLDSVSRRHLRRLIKENATDGPHILLLCLCKHIQLLDLRMPSDIDLQDYPQMSVQETDDAMEDGTWVPFITSVMAQLPMVLTEARLFYDDWAEMMDQSTFEFLMRLPTLRVFKGEHVYSYLEDFSPSLQRLSLSWSTIENWPKCPQLQACHIAWDTEDGSMESPPSFSEIGDWIRRTPLREFALRCPFLQSGMNERLGSLADTALESLTVTMAALLGKSRIPPNLDARAKADLLASLPRLSDVLPASLKSLVIEHAIFDDDEDMPVHLHAELIKLMGADRFSELLDITVEWYVFLFEEDDDKLEQLLGPIEKSVPPWTCKLDHVYNEDKCRWTAKRCKPLEQNVTQ